MTTANELLPVGAVLINPSDRWVVQRVYDFFKILQAADRLPPNEEEYWDRPWKWQPEYQTWVNVGSPEEESPAWDRFIEALREDA